MIAARVTGWRRVLPCALWLVLLLVAWFVGRHSPAQLVTGPFAGPGPDALLGGDRLGRDVFSQVLRGGQGLIAVAVLIAVLVTGLATAAALAAALIGWLRWVITAISDVLIVIPALLGVLLVVLAWPDGGVAAVVLAAVLFGVPYTQRVLQPGFDVVARRGHVEAARASGEPLLVVMTGEMLPALLRSVLTQLGLRFTEGLYVISAMGFLRLPGLLGEHNWAVMVRDNASGALLNPWGILAPSLAIVVTVLVVQVALPSEDPYPAALVSEELRR